MNFLRNIFLTFFIGFLFINTGNTQRVKELKKDVDYSLIQRANFSVSFYVGGEFDLQYQLGIQRNKHSFLLGLGPGFFSKYNTKGCNFLGVSSGFEYNFGSKWRFVTGVSTFNGWVLDKNVVAATGGCLSAYRSTIAIPLGCMYSFPSGFFIELSYLPLLDIPTISGNVLNFRLAIGFATIKKLKK